MSRTRRIIFTTFLVELLYFIVRGAISFMISYSEFGSAVLRNVLFYTAPYFVGIVSCIVGAVLTYIGKGNDRMSKPISKYNKKVQLVIGLIVYGVAIVNLIVHSLVQYIMIQGASLDLLMYVFYFLGITELFTFTNIITLIVGTIFINKAFD